MPEIEFVQADGTRRKIVADIGDSIMIAATEGGVRGILARCGGSCSCATCHVYVAPEWADGLPAMSPHEDEMLYAAEAERRPTSRLSCQIVLTAAMDGIVVHVPDRQ
ncbi:MAG: ferredoxin [Sphingomonas bacterium]|uniref:2Fe-2S iron-sulfur cluster-binding protein n=1 Tax=Sphingomonas bacterium TaxID=1895847 RepID=UPI00260F8FB6|nr:2Fe-2S iron-sulfur cluster-binding protein [Sphingomonas bacterium]MDB5704457.1 ferredoxin [Sphingomonas bacterium]